MKQYKSLSNDFQTSFCQDWLDLALSIRHLSVLIICSPERFYSLLCPFSEEVLLFDVISHECVEYVSPTVILCRCSI